MSVYFLSFLLLKYSRIRSAVICIAAVSMSMLFELARISLAFDKVWPKVFVTISNILILQITALVLSKKKNSYTVFIGFSSSIFVLAGNITSCAVILATQSYPIAMAACTLVNTAVFICTDKLIKDICVHILSKEISIWMCIIPAMCYITFYLLLYFPVYFEQRPDIMFAAISLLITVVVMYILLIQYIYTKSSEKKLTWRNKELHAYIRGIQLQTDVTESAIQDCKAMRHDMRHKDQLLLELLHSKKYLEAAQVLQTDMKYLEKSYIANYCENAVINSILCGMAKKAEHMGIRFEIGCAIPKKQGINDYDLAIVTANLLENAMQAVSHLKQEERYIKVMLKNRKGEQFFVETKNPCHETIKFSKKTGMPLSSQGTGHGFGMVNVQKFIEKYHAQFDCYLEGGIFIVRILIHLNGGEGHPLPPAENIASTARH